MRINRVSGGGAKPLVNPARIPQRQDKPKYTFAEVNDISRLRGLGGNALSRSRFFIVINNITGNIVIDGNTNGIIVVEVSG